MKGTMIVMSPNGEVTSTALDRPPDLEAIKAGIGGGWLEKVPGFNVYLDDKNVPHRAVALCDEDGKRKKMLANGDATGLWHAALRASGHPGLFVNGGMADYLVGPVVVLYGDAEFMESL